jgi:hypothetical protein
MNHLETGLSSTNLSETGRVRAGLKLCLLLSRKMEKAQCQLTATVADSNQQISAPAKDSFGKQNFARD